MWLLLSAAVLGVAVPHTAWAHGYLKTATPAPNARVSTVIHELRLDFTESPELAFTTVRLLNPTGGDVALGTAAYPSDSHRSIVLPLMAPLARAGTYTVVWQMAGTDGHVTRGTYTFTLLQSAVGSAVPGTRAGGPVSSAGITPASATHHTGVSSGTTFSADSPIYVAIRWLSFLALLTMLGAVTFRLFVVSHLRGETDPHFPMLGEAKGHAARLATRAAWALAATALLRLAAQSYAMHGANLDLGFLWTMLTQTMWGLGWFLQLAALAVAAAGFHGAARERTYGWTVATLGTAALAFTPGLSGHAASVPHWTPLAILADGMHVIGAGGWLGSLLFVIAAGIPAARVLPAAQRGTAVADLVNAFSPTALAFAGITTATGVFAAWIHLGSIPALWQTRYGITLLVKLAVLSIVAATGAYNWLRVKPALGDEVATLRLRRSAKVELAVGVVVLAVTAVLVATPTAMDLQAMTH